ncbi:galactitol-1-phosphate 5-dehydrogenase [Lactobacillus salivarius]|uniref:Alcohol dehydrogenase n=1 Tax=Ligilactobacillus salivarius TaxID=1624 RepID=A0A089QKX4_9LACO|nr:galactitol-1-phosphate 5-dehydrogenase [Ligilactobacillus salivarius]AIR11611.1 Alcohol dehydrogenase [Ligilactobacillus salivarius]AOO74415.1 galactitol-1-phosphate 5-dehydrogenase [Ligilactobacillus salivarius]MBL1058297.1 galactitol-1-phosphate 5-dehydrogenase [Ligilactobacillus salivarius]MDN4849153.1 galactitol-1-phosphate 5-dehydrogenase [Ligilactobacillus salivarius]NXZ96638.1 galactitol-1-phosphate 5-dehydrogenase [Ligilactobacillus salivarius]
MKVAELVDLNKFNLVEKDLPTPSNNEVRVKVMAAGTCGSDSHKMKAGWKYGFPAVMGHEFSGIIDAVGGDVENIEVGERVAVAPFIPCFECEYCQSGMFQMCENYAMVGQTQPGGFEQYVCVPARNVLSIGNLSFTEGALIEPMAVAMHAVMGINPEIGDTAAVFGLGAIGDLVIRLLKAAGVVNIIGIDIDDKKLEKGLEEGCSYVINSVKESLEEKVAEYTNGQGVDITMECAGSKITEEQSLLITKRRGKVGFVGIAYSDVMLHKDAFENIFRHELTVKGFWNSYSAPFPGKEWTTSIKMVKNGSVKIKDLVTHKFELDEIQDAFNMIVSRSESYNKVMFYPNGIE